MISDEKGEVVSGLGKMGDSNGEVLRDERAREHNGFHPYNEEVAGSHHADTIWVSMGSNPAKEAHRKKHRSKRHESREKGGEDDTIPLDRADTQPVPADADEFLRRQNMGPGQRIQFLLNEDDEEADSPSVAQHALFTEMAELHNEEWRETARWVKFEEDVEEGGNRWSKPHVATLSLHSLFELRSLLMNGCVILDLEATELSQIVEVMLDKMVADKQVEFQYRDEVRDAILRRHTHQYESKTGGSGGGGSHSGRDGHGFINTVRSIADIGRSFSHGKNMHAQIAANEEGQELSKKFSVGQQLSLPKIGSAPKDVCEKGKDESSKGNQHFLKKLPIGAEASNVLIGEVNFLEHHASAFIRLKTATSLGDLTEVPVPTRFLFILLGPTGHGSQFKEIGRAVATLMSDEIFRDVAYKARSRNDLLDGLDEFLDQVTVLPPGEWDPNIRIEPPSTIPSQEKRKQTVSSAPGGGEGGGGGDDPNKTMEILQKEEENLGAHGKDPALKRTGRLFGGLILDIKRKAPFYLSDYKDALNMQCVATFCFMYFALLAPIVTFGGLLEEGTGQQMAAMENLLSGAICGITYHLFAGQPLTIIGSTGPVLVFETTIHDMCKEYGINYMSFRFWINTWTTVILLIIVATDASSMVSYITRFTEESFATLIALIFIIKSLQKLFSLLSYVDTIPFDVETATVEALDCSCSGGAKVISPKKFPYMWKAGIKHNVDFRSASWFTNLSKPDASGNLIESAKFNYSDMSLSECNYFRGKPEGPDCYPIYDVFFLSAILMIGTFVIAMGLKSMRNGSFFPNKVRQALSDFAVIIAIVSMSAVDVAFGLNTPKLNVPEEFRPTSPKRGWIIYPFEENAWWTAILALLPALLACILFFMDQQITVVIVNRKENRLKKGCGYHLDLFIVSILVFITGLMGLPIYIAATVLSINHVNSLRVESESRAPGEVATFVGVREQRVTGILTFVFIGLSVLMTNVLKYISMPVLYGVFLYMGLASLKGIQMMDRLLLFLMPMKYQPDYVYLRNVPITRVHLFTIIQVTCLAILWIIKSISQTKIAFPIMLVVIIGVRKMLEHVFSAEELYHLDDPMPEMHLRKKDDAKKKKKLQEKKKKDEEESAALEEENPELRTVKTEAHLHIPMATGNVMKIPLTSIAEEPKERPINISDGINKSGVWRHIASESSFRVQPDNGKTVEETNTIDETEEDYEPITIKIDQNRNAAAAKAVDGEDPKETQPLLKTPQNNGKQESSV